MMSAKYPLNNFIITFLKQEGTFIDMSDSIPKFMPEPPKKKKKIAGLDDFAQDDDE